MEKLNIITDDKGIVFKMGSITKRRGFNAVDYEFVENDTVIFRQAYDGATIYSSRLGNFSLNGETLTTDNYDDKLKDALYKSSGGGGSLSGTLTIRINDVDILTFDGSSDQILNITPDSLDVYSKDDLANALIVDITNNNSLELKGGASLDEIRIESETTFAKPVDMQQSLHGTDAFFAGPVHAPEFIQ